MSETTQAKILTIPPDFDSISFKELLEHCLSPGEVHLNRARGKTFKLLKAGDFVDRDYLKKYSDDKFQLIVKRSVDPSYVKEWTDVFLEFKYAKDEKTKIQARKLILQMVKRDFWHGGSNSSILDLIYACEKVFLKYDYKILKNLEAVQTAYLKRSFIIASVIPVCAIILGYMDFSYLQDLYNLGILFDFSLDPEIFTFDISEVLEMERENSGQGEVYAHDFKNGKEIIDRVKKSSKILHDSTIKKLITYFNKIDSINILKKMHEKFDGTGFPYGLNSFEMSDVECLFCLVHGSIELDSLSCQRGEGATLVKKILNTDNIHFPLRRCQKVLINELSRVNEDELQKLKEAVE